MKTNQLNKLSNPIFIISVILLLFNDFYLKQAYGNVITGKLSDFAGLFAFPFLFSCLLPRYKKTIHIITVLLFVWWKSTFAQPFIDVVNLWGIPIDRVVDFSDNIALISVLCSYYVFSISYNYKTLNPVFKAGIFSVSIFSFIATQLPAKTALEFTSVDKEYVFPMSRNEFIYKFNELQKKEMKKIPDFLGVFDEKSGVFYTNDYDTLTYLINIDKHINTDTIRISNYLSHFQIYSRGNDTTVLKLINIAGITGIVNDSAAVSLAYYRDSTIYQPPKLLYKGYNYGYPLVSLLKNPDNEKWKNKAIKRFEKRVVKQIKK